MVDGAAFPHEAIGQIVEELYQKLVPVFERGPKVMLTIDEVSELIGLSKPVIVREIEAGKFPRPAFGGGRGSKYLWNRKDIENFHGVRS